MGTMGEISGTLKLAVERGMSHVLVTDVQIANTKP
jgi:hypothetical protein